MIIFGVLESIFIYNGEAENMGHNDARFLTDKCNKLHIHMEFAWHTKNKKTLNSSSTLKVAQRSPKKLLTYLYVCDVFYAPTGTKQAVWAVVSSQVTLHLEPQTKDLSEEREDYFNFTLGSSIDALLVFTFAFREEFIKFFVC